MTDEQIIKALDVCANDISCENCPLKGEKLGKGCLPVRAFYNRILDLINRQKAEIEEFKKVIDNMADKLVQKDAEIEKSVKTIDGLIVGQKTLFEREKTAKSEAIKEFAERLKASMFNYYECLSESAKGRPYKGDTLMDYEVVDMIEDCILQCAYERIINTY